MEQYIEFFISMQCSFDLWSCCAALFRGLAVQLFSGQGVILGAVSRNVIDNSFQYVIIKWRGFLRMP